MRFIALTKYTRATESRWWRRLIEVAAYPGVVVVAVAVGYLWLQAGTNPALVLPVMIGATGLGIFALEHLHPYVGEWRLTPDKLRADLLHTVFSNGAVQLGFEALFLGGLVWVADEIAGTVGLELWPTTWPVIAQLALGLVVIELATYWVHRTFHNTTAGWKIHSVHHSSDQLYLLASARNHPLAVVCMAAAELSPLVLLGAPGELIALSALFTAVHGMIQHANVEMRPGFLHWVMSAPDLHRWHHAREVEDANANFGNNLIIWDLVFGTRFLPADRPVPTTAGIEGMAFPESYKAQLAAPWIFKSLFVESEDQAA